MLDKTKLKIFYFLFFGSVFVVLSMLFYLFLFFHNNLVEKEMTIQDYKDCVEMLNDEEWCIRKLNQ